MEDAQGLDAALGAEPLDGQERGELLAGAVTEGAGDLVRVDAGEEVGRAFLREVRVAVLEEVAVAWGGRVWCGRWWGGVVVKEEW